MIRERCARVGALAALVLGCAGTAAAAEPAPRLVLVLAVDQLRPDRISAELPGGIGRLQREGRSFVDAALAHAFTETCPGHATMLSGRHPARIGIPANTYTDPKTLERRYCVEDRAPDAAIVGLGRSPGSSKPRDGRSPRVMRGGTLGEWLKAQRPGARVFAVSGKDRAAIAMGGRGADAAYWLARGESPRFVTSGFYRKELPDWVAAWGPQKVLAPLPAVWEYLPASIAVSSKTARPDDYAFESPALGRTAPHPLKRDPPGAEQAPAQFRYPAERMYVTPFADDVTLAFARDLVEREKLGRGPQPDLLAISLSATDLVGHFYGPESWEARDALMRLDASVGELLSFLEKRVAAGRLLVVLTADHGVLPLPEWIQETGRSKCKLPGGRLSGNDLVTGLNAHLDARFGARGAEPEDEPRDKPKRAEPARGGDWFVATSGRLTLDRRRATRMGVAPEKLVEAARAHLESVPGVARAWTRDEVLAGGGPEPLATYYRNSWDPEIAGDIAIQTDEDCLLSDLRISTSHGSPYAYDRRVPLVFFGPGVAPGRVPGRAATVDIAPTLASLLGVEVPKDLDGRVLPLR